MDKNPKEEPLGDEPESGEKGRDPVGFRDTTLRPDSDLNTIYGSLYDPAKLHDPIT